MDYLLPQKLVTEVIDVLTSIKHSPMSFKETHSFIEKIVSYQVKEEKKPIDKVKK